MALSISSRHAHFTIDYDSIVSHPTDSSKLQVIKHSGSDQLLLMMRLMEGSVHTHSQFSSHPGAVGAFFTLLVLGLKTCECLVQSGSRIETFGVQLLQDRIYRCVQFLYCFKPKWQHLRVEKHCKWLSSCIVQ